MKILSIFNCLCKWFLMFLFWISCYNCTFSKCLNMWLIKVSSFLFLIIFLLRKPSLCDKVWVIPSMQNVHGIRIYNCEVESILAFIELTVFKTPGRGSDGGAALWVVVLTAPGSKRACTYVSFIMHSSVVVFCLWIVTSVTDFSMTPEARCRFLMFCPKSGFFFRSRLVSRLCSVSLHVWVSLLAWHHCARLSQRGSFAVISFL